MEELKFIVNELNKTFDTDYNMISFDSLPITELLQVVINVLNIVDATPKFDVSKNKDQAIMNTLNALQTVKYVPEKDIDAAEFREGLIMGKRNIVHPILYWLLSNSEKVKKRVYFASYVEKVVIPPEIMQDAEVEQMNLNYDKLIEDFWVCYNENKNEKKNAEESNELQEDTSKMAADMSYLLQRLDIQNDKLKNIPNRESLLTSVKAYRREVKQEKKLQAQLKEHKNVLTQFATEVKTLQAALHQTSSRRPENLDPLQQIGEEVQINKILADSQLPREEQEVVMELSAFEKVSLEPEPSQEELESINNSMEQLNQAIQALLNKKMALTNTNDDQLLPFRNQAMIIANKKQELSNFIMKVKAKNEAVLEVINQKSMTLREIVGGDILHGEELKIFIANLRERSGVYKKCRAFMQGLQAELGIVSRTLEILKIGDATIENAIKTNKNKPKEQNNDIQIDDVSELKYKCKTLYQEANSKRAETVRIYDDLIQMRGVYSNMTDNFNESKREFDNATGNLSDELVSTEKNLEEADENIKKSENEWKSLQKEIENYEMIVMKYSDNLTNGVGISSVIDQLADKLKELERKKKDLDNEHVHIKQLKNVEQEELEMLKRMKQMVLFKIQGS